MAHVFNYSLYNLFIESAFPRQDESFYYFKYTVTEISDAHVWLPVINMQIYSKRKSSKAEEKETGVILKFTSTETNLYGSSEKKETLIKQLEGRLILDTLSYWWKFTV